MWYALATVLLALIIIIEAWSGVRASYSAWQIRKKQQLVDKQTKNASSAARDLRRLRLKTSLLNLQASLLILLYVALFVVLSRILGTTRAWLPLILAIPLTNLVAKFKPIVRQVDLGYSWLEVKLLKVLEVIYPVNRFLTVNSLLTTDSGVFDHVDSLSELFFVIENSPSVVGELEQLLIKSGLKFFDLTAEQVMKPLDEVFTLEADEVLGPLRIDELHKTGSEFFPVLEAKGQALGVVSLSSIANLDNKETKTARQAIGNNSVQVEVDESLENVLSRLINEQAAVALIVKRGRPVGILTLKKLLTQLIGRQI